MQRWAKYYLISIHYEASGMKKSILLLRHTESREKPIRVKKPCVLSIRMTSPEMYIVYQFTSQNTLSPHSLVTDQSEDKLFS